MTSRPTGSPRPAWATTLLLLAQVAVWIVVRRYLLPAGEWVDFAITPAAPEETSFLTAPFVHLEAAHLGLNLAVLWLFGAQVERSLGSLTFLAFYLGSGWFSSLMQWAAITCFHAVTEESGLRAAVGSSGAVAGILAVHLVRFPGARFALPGHARSVRAAPVVVAWAGYTSVRALAGTLAGSPEGIGHWAHLSGFVFGLGISQASRLHVLARADELRRRGDVAWSTGDYAKCSLAWSLLLRLQPDDLELRKKLTGARLAAGDREAAGTLATEGITRAVRAGDRTATTGMYREYLSLLGTLRLSPGIRYRVAAWLLEEGSPQEAFAAFLTSAREEASEDSAANSIERAARLAAETLNDPNLELRALRRLSRDYPASAAAARAQQRLAELER